MSSAGPSGYGHSCPLTMHRRAARCGLGRKVDVAFMKFCCIVLSQNTNVDALFASYRDEFGRPAAGVPRRGVPPRHRSV